MIVYTKYATTVATVAGRRILAVLVSEVIIVSQTMRNTAEVGMSKQHVDSRSINELTSDRHDARLNDHFEFLTRVRPVNAQSHEARHVIVSWNLCAYVFVLHIW